MNKEEFLSKRYAIDLKLKELNGEREQLEKEYIESNQGFPIGSKVCITVPAHERNNERILVPEAKKLAYIADYDIDVLRLLLISYGFCRNIEISTYIGDGGWIGYEVSASNDDGIEYYAVDCEGLLFHIYEIQKFMRDGNIEPRLMLGNSSNKHLLSDESLNKLLNMSENKNYCKTNPYE